MHWGLDGYYEQTAHSTPHRSHQKRHLVLDESESVRIATIQARPGTYPPLLEVGDAKQIDINTITDYSSAKVQDVAAFAKLPLAQRRAAMWGDKCALCQARFDDTSPLVLCTTCREFRYCNIACRGKHMYHSFDGCFAKPANRVSDQHRIRHILTGDAAALETSLTTGTVGMRFKEQNPKITLAYGEVMSLLELAAYTGDQQVVFVLVHCTNQAALSCTPPRPLCACIALDRNRIDALVCMFVREVGSYAKIADVPGHLGMRILGAILEATKSKNFPGAVPASNESKEHQRLMRAGGFYVQGGIDRASTADIDAAFFSQRRQIIQLFWSLLGLGLRFDTTPTWAKFVAQALSLWSFYYDSIHVSGDTLQHLLKCDASRPKMMDLDLLYRLIAKGTPAILRYCLASGFGLSADIDVHLPVSGTVAAFLPVLSTRIKDGGWTPHGAVFPGLNAIKISDRDTVGHDILMRAWLHYTHTPDDATATIQWLASQGAEFSEIDLRKWASDVKTTKAVVYGMDTRRWHIQPHLNAGYEALESGFKAYVALVRQALFERIEKFPTDIIDRIIVKYLVQGELAILISVLKAQLLTSVDEHNQNHPPIIVNGMFAGFVQ